jgi:hypothetical protein
MTSFSSGSGPGPRLADSDARVADKTADKRTSYIKNKDGDAVGNNYLVPKSDFANFMGKAPAGPGAGQAGHAPTGRSVIEMALQRELRELGEGAAKRGNTYRNLFVANGRYQNEPGREKDMIKDGLDSIKAGPDMNSTQKKNSSSAASNNLLSGAQKQYFAKVEEQQKQSVNDNMRYLEMQYKFQEIGKQDGTISNLMKTRHDAVSRVIRGGQ